MSELAVILVAHGTRNAQGQATTLAVRDRVAQARPDADVLAAYVDVQTPTVADAVAEAAANHARVVVIPLLFCGGYHVQVDIAKAIDGYDNAVSTGPLGPSELLAKLLVERLEEAGAQRHDPLIMAAAGSSRPEANAGARAQARLLREAWGAPVDVAFGSAGTPRVGDAVMANRDRPGARVAVAALLLGEGHFASVLRSCGADIVTEPLGAADEVIEQILMKLAGAIG